MGVVKKISSIIATIYVVGWALLKAVGVIMDILGFPELAGLITEQLSRPDGSLDYIQIGFWVGLIALIALNWRSMSDFFSGANKQTVPATNTKISDNEVTDNYGITLECKPPFLSDEAREFCQYLCFDFMNPAGTLSSSGLPIGPAPPELERFRCTDLIRSVMNIELSNRGEYAIFNISIPVVAEFRECIQEDDKRVSKSGDVIKRSSLELNLGKLILEPNSSIIFQLCNSTPHFLQLNLSKYFDGETHVARKATISYIRIDDTYLPISLLPTSRKQQ